MPLPDRSSQHRLEAMGIQLWARRDLVRAAAGVCGSALEPRVRLSSGDGSWLLVQRRPWDGSQATLVADITALLGPDRCCFGQWSGGSAAGLAVSELVERGIVRIIAFGALPAAVTLPGLIEAPELAELAGDADARRRFWTALRPALSS